MNAENAVGLAIAAALVVYLLVTQLWPERF